LNHLFEHPVLVVVIFDGATQLIGDALDVVGGIAFDAEDIAGGMAIRVSL
jgi:hypothetical protein